MPLASREKLAVVLANPPRWIERAVVVHVQAKHCVAVEMEYSLRAGGQDDITAAAMWEMIPALHEEACALASQLLSPGHPVRQLSDRAAGQADGRRCHDGDVGVEPLRSLSSTRDCRPGSAPVARAHRRGASSSCPSLLSDAARPSSAAIWGSRRGEERRTQPPERPAVQRPASSPGQRAAGQRQQRAPRAASSSTVAERGFGQVESESLSWPEGGPSLGGENLLLASSEEAAEGRRRGSAAAGAGASAGAGAGARGGGGPPPLDIFAEWMQSNIPRGKQELVAWKLRFDEGVQELHRGMRQESQHFRAFELPKYSPEEIFDSRTRYSDYGMRVHKDAERQQCLREAGGRQSGAGGSAAATAAATIRRPTSAAASVASSAASGAGAAACRRAARPQSGQASELRRLARRLQRSSPSNEVE